MPRVVVDASALLALLAGEPGAEMVREHAREAIVCAVNVSEVLAKQVAHGFPARLAAERMDALPLRVVAFDAVMARLAVDLIPTTGLAFGDRACLALAKLLDLPVLTADRAWKNLDLGIAIRLIR